MNFSIKINPGQIIGEITQVASAVIRKATSSLELKLKNSLTGLRTGRIYRRKSRIHQASARGEAPATDFGNLLGSITSSFAPTRGVVRIGAEYAEILEEVLDRPFVRPAIKDVLDELGQDVTGGIGGF